VTVGSRGRCVREYELCRAINLECLARRYRISAGSPTMQSLLSKGAGASDVRKLPAGGMPNWSRSTWTPINYCPNISIHAMKFEGPQSIIVRATTTPVSFSAAQTTRYPVHHPSTVSIPRPTQFRNFSSMPAFRFGNRRKNHAGSNRARDDNVRDDSAPHPRPRTRNPKAG
jgi:hypothetical protein